MGCFGAVWQTTLQQHVPEEALSRAAPGTGMGSFPSPPLGLIPPARCRDPIGIPTTLWISVAHLIALHVVVVLVSSVRDLRRLDEPESTQTLAAARRASR